MQTVTVPPARWALVLAGGEGTRLQELTRRITGKPIPKQYCRILGERSLLETTLDRMAHFAPREQTLAIINRGHVPIARRQLRDVPSENILVQPCSRDTGPGLLFALLHLARQAPRAIVAAFPSDHYVGDDRAFIDCVDQACRIVERLPEKIVLLGIRPNHPEPGLGYIAPALPLKVAGYPAFHVKAFREKPDPHVAERLYQQGALWNSFVMAFRVDRMLQLLRNVVPRHAARMRMLHEHPEALAAGYPALMRWNFSSEFLVRVPQHLVVLRVDGVHWSDWGTEGAIERTLSVLGQIPTWSKQWHGPAAA